MSTSNEDIQLCARYGGQCCLTKPGIEDPARFVVNGNLVDRLIYYPRPATLQERGQHGYAASPEGGACVFLTPTGCRLGFDERPRLCRKLVAVVCFECESPWGRRDAALAWLPWQEQATAGITSLPQPRTDA